MMVEIIESNNSFTLNLKLEQWITNHKDYHKIVDIPNTPHAVNLSLWDTNGEEKE